MTTPDSEQQPDLLRFARDVYGQPGIRTLCLRLQDEHGADVVLLLMCCWYGCCQGLLTEAILTQAATFSDSWRTQLVQPLRDARRWLKPHPADTVGIPGAAQEALRQRIKALELDAEFMQLRALAELAADPAAPAEPRNSRPDQAATVRNNLMLYARYAPGHDLHSGLNEQAIAALVNASVAISTLARPA